MATKFEKKVKSVKSCPLESEGVELQYLVHSMSLWTPTKFVHNYDPGVKTGPVTVYKFKHRNKDSKQKNYSSLKLNGIEL